MGNGAKRLHKLKSGMKGSSKTFLCDSNDPG